MFSLAQAAKATGKSRPTIARAIKNGRLSASRADDGSYEIDPAELSRVFPLAGQDAGTMKQTVPGNGAGTSPAISAGEVEALHARIAEQTETIRQLWQRLDVADQRVAAEAEERRRLLALLTDQRRRPWWRRWFR